MSIMEEEYESDNKKQRVSHETGSAHNSSQEGWFKERKASGSSDKSNTSSFSIRQDLRQNPWDAAASKLWSEAKNFYHKPFPINEKGLEAVGSISSMDQERMENVGEERKFQVQVPKEIVEEQHGEDVINEGLEEIVGMERSNNQINAEVEYAINNIIVEEKTNAGSSQNIGDSRNSVMENPFPGENEVNKLDSNQESVEIVTNEQQVYGDVNPVGVDWQMKSCIQSVVEDVVPLRMLPPEEHTGVALVRRSSRLVHNDSLTALEKAKVRATAKNDVGVALAGSSSIPTHSGENSNFGSTLVPILFDKYSDGQLHKFASLCAIKLDSQEGFEPIEHIRQMEKERATSQ